MNVCNEEDDSRRGGEELGGFEVVFSKVCKTWRSFSWKTKVKMACHFGLSLFRCS
jgi:hypothetical protein